jgi:RNA polymerase sigma-70 factor (ECF subfamily)
LTGCGADADDVVQETFSRALLNANAPDSWRAWLVRVATNLSLDVLRLRRRRYPGSWLPSPIDSEAAENGTVFESAEAVYGRKESITYAFLLALEALTPRQRAVLVLRDVFDYSGREVAVALSISEENVRVTHLRARRAMSGYDGNRTRPTPELRQRCQQALESLLRCLVTDDVGGLAALLADSVCTLTDAGGEFNALHGPLAGRDRVATLYLRVARRRGQGARMRFCVVNEMPAVLIEYASAERRQAPRLLLRCEVGEDGRIEAIHSVLSSRKLRSVRF